MLRGIFTGSAGKYIKIFELFVNVQRLILLNILLYNEMLRGIFTGSAGKYIKIFELLMCDIE